MLTTEKIKELKNVVDHFQERKQHAVERLSVDQGSQWYFALLGFRLAVSEYHIENIATLRPVVEPPNEFELAAALRNKDFLSAVSRYSYHIRYELGIDRTFSDEDQGAFNLAWWIISALRIRTLSDFLVPAVSDYSWSTIAAAPDDSCNIQLLEDIPLAKRFSETVCVSKNDMNWVEENLLSFAQLLERPHFRLAVECLTTHQHEASLRMTAASLWAGIESLFRISAELRFRIASLTAAFLEPRGPERIARYREVKKMYDFRSRAVHGSQLDNTELEQHIRDVRLMLSSLLCKMIENNRIPSEEDWDAIMFGKCDG